MLRYLRHSILFLLLGSYVALGIVGHIEVLQVFSLGTTPQYLSQPKAGFPPVVKVYWTQNKHIPSTVKISVPSPVVLSLPVTPCLHIFWTFLAPEIFDLHNDPLNVLLASRAPPQV